MSEPTSYSERNIDQEVELHRLQELLRTGGTAEQVEETSKQTIAAGSQSSSVNFTTSSTTTEAEDAGPRSRSGKTADPLARTECVGSAILKERRTYFMQNGRNRLTGENGEQKRHSVDVSRVTDGVTFQESAGSAAATSEPIVTPSLPSTSRPGEVTLAVPSSRADKMQRAVEQHMQQLADDLQKTFNATTALSLPNAASEQCQQETAAVRPAELSAGDTAARCAADSQSVTSDYSTMSSLCGGQDRSNRLVSVDLEMLAAPDADIQKIADRSTLDCCRKRNEAPHGTARSQSSGNFSLTNNDLMESSPYTASAMELSQDSIDSAADRSDQLSLSLSSQMSSSQMSDSDDLLHTVGVADKQSYSPLVQPSGPVDHKSCNIDSSCVMSAANQVEQFGEPTVTGSTLQSIQRDLSAARTDSETDVVLDKQSCDVDPVSSEKQDVCRVQVGDSTVEMSCVNAELARPEQVTPFEQKTDCSNGTDICHVMPSVDGNNKGISVFSSKYQFLQSQHPVHRVVRRHTLGGMGDLAIHVADRKSESPLSVQSAPSQDEGRLSAWQRLKPGVKDHLPNFGMWLAMQRQLYHVRSSPALFVGVALTPASCLHSSQLNCQSVV